MSLQSIYRILPVSTCYRCNEQQKRRAYDQRVCDVQMRHFHHLLSFQLLQLVAVDQLLTLFLRGWLLALPLTWISPTFTLFLALLPYWFLFDAIYGFLFVWLLLPLPDPSMMILAVHERHIRFSFLVFYLFVCTLLNSNRYNARGTTRHVLLSTILGVLATRIMLLK